jgi:hypothetical protein
VVCGIWRLVYDIWRMAYGVWRMAYGVWRMAYGVWRMAEVWNGLKTFIKKRAITRTFIVAAEAVDDREVAAACCLVKIFWVSLPTTPGSGSDGHDSGENHERIEESCHF